MLVLQGFVWLVWLAKIFLLRWLLGQLGYKVCEIVLDALLDSESVLFNG